MRVASVLFLVLLCLTSRARSQVSVDTRALDSIAPAQPPARVAPAPPRQPPDVAAAPRPAPASHVRRRAVARKAPDSPPNTSVAPASVARTPSSAGGTGRTPSAAAVTPPIPALPTAQPSP